MTTSRLNLRCILSGFVGAVANVRASEGNEKARGSPPYLFGKMALISPSGKANVTKPTSSGGDLLVSLVPCDVIPGLEVRHSKSKAAIVVPERISEMV